MIKSLGAPPWWKVRFSERWRGAIAEDGEGAGQPWLVGAGIRRDGADDDFYERFPADVASKGRAHFEPTDKDRARLALEASEGRRVAWSQHVYVTVLETVAAAVEVGTASCKIESPESDGSVIADLEVTVFDLDEDDLPHLVPAEVAVHLRVLDYGNVPALREAQRLACAAVSPCEEDWDVAPEAVGVRLMALVTRARIDQIVASATIVDKTAHEPAPPPVVAPVTRAHYAVKGTLAAAVVQGEPVRAICGQWFVPRQDPTDMPVCEECSERYAANALRA